MTLLYTAAAIQDRTFLKGKILIATVREIARLGMLVKHQSNNRDRIVREIRVISKIVSASFRGINKLCEFEGYNEDTACCDIYKTCSEVLRLHFDTNDMYLEMKHYLEQELKCSIIF